jgi:hypothetical protein
MRYRKLRIAWSVAWGVLAVLLLTLWVRSYGRLDLPVPLKWRLASRINLYASTV